MRKYLGDYYIGYIYRMFPTHISPKISNKFYCEKCNYKCNKKSEFNKHLSTNKHNIPTNPTSNPIYIDTPRIYSCECGKIYKHASTLYHHKKKCTIVQAEHNNELEVEQPINDNLFTQKMVEMVLSQNKEVMNVIMDKVALNQNDFMNKMMEIMPQMMPQIGNTTNNNTNSHNTTNNQFNIQMFLNEHCKNAMNLTDFVQSLPITSETYDSTIENGLTKTITNLMLNGLNELDILERPIHCTDASRKTLYVKESDTWEKDNELLHVIDSIKYLSVKQRGMIKTWKEANEGWRTKDKLQSKMSTLIIHSMKLIERDEKETSKIIRSISKNVYLNDETKKMYM